MTLKKLTLAVLFLTLISTTQGCEEDSQSASISISITPSEPRVQVASVSFKLPDHTTSNPSLKTVEGPLFPLTYTITNNSTKYLTITSFSLEVEARSSSGTQVVTFNSDLSDFDDERKTIVDALAPNAAFPEPVTWYFGNLPELSSFRYRGKMTFIGYFLLEDDPATEAIETGLPGDRFQKTIRFTTR